MKHSHLLATDRQHSVIDDSTHGLRVYTAYGLSAIQGGPMSAFCGEPRDPLTGCYHLGNGYRQFNPSIMRFHAPDTLSPFGKGGINAYMYCAGDPVNHSDPSGAIILPTVQTVAVGALYTSGLALGFTSPGLRGAFNVNTTRASTLGSIIGLGGIGLSYSAYAAVAPAVGTVGTVLVAGALTLQAGKVIVQNLPLLGKIVASNTKKIFLGGSGEAKGVMVESRVISASNEQLNGIDNSSVTRCSSVMKSSQHGHVSINMEHFSAVKSSTGIRRKSI